jgi:hypothetical protein
VGGAEAGLERFGGRGERMEDGRWKKELSRTSVGLVAFWLQKKLGIGTWSVLLSMLSDCSRHDWI